jgi:hypothetical protein
MARSLLLAFLPGVLSAQMPTEPARIVYFRAVPANARQGEPVTLQWSATGTEQVVLDPPGQPFPAQGSLAWVVVKERAVFWLHAANLRGSQSAPLVLDPPPALAREPMPPLPGLPKAAPLPLPQRPAAALPGLAAKEWWIQFAVLSNPRNVARLRRNLELRAGITPRLWPMAAPGSTAPATSVRIGPYTDPQAAVALLKRMHHRMRALHLRPVVIWDGPPVQVLARMAP